MQAKADRLKMDTGITVSTTEIVSAITALFAFIGVLLKVIHQNLKETKDRLKAFEAKSDNQVKQVIELTGLVHRLEGEREGHLNGIERLTAEVIHEVRRLKDD